MMRGLILALLGLAACEIKPPNYDLSNLVQQDISCDMAFDPMPELTEATEIAADRWSEATGCDVWVEAGGYPVNLWPHVFAFELPSGGYEVRPTNDSGDGLSMCGGKINDAIYISAGSSNCPDRETAVAHEIGHFFGRPGTHAATGLARARIEKGEAPLIDSATLEWACEVTPCRAFSPEE